MNIKVDILSLKHELEVMQSSLHYNVQIANGSGIRAATVGRFVKGDITIIYLPVLTRFARYFILQGLTVEIGDFFCWEGEELVSNIGPLIARLEEAPTDEEISSETGIPLSRMNNLLRGNVKRVYLSDLAALLTFFRQREVDIKLGDLLREEEEVDSSPNYRPSEP